MIKVLVLSIWYPLSMSRYFERALRRRKDLDVKTVGTFTGSWIPWAGGMTLPEKYAIAPDIALPFPPIVNRASYALVRANLPTDWKPDIVLAIDAGMNWIDKPHEGVVATIATDPHVLDYSHARRISDKFFNMQKCYSEREDIYLPYAYDPTVHYPQPSAKDLDAMLIGLPYTHVPRLAWIQELQKMGLNVYTENGAVFDEYRAIANRAKVGLNWSTMQDLNARFFETPAFGLPMVSNLVPDADLFLEQDVDYLAFTSLPEAISKVKYLLDHPDQAENIAANGHKKIRPHNYDHRVVSVLSECLHYAAENRKTETAPASPESI